MSIAAIPDLEGDDVVIDLTGPEEDDWIKLSTAALADLALPLLGQRGGPAHRRPQPVPAPAPPRAVRGRSCALGPGAGLDLAVIPTGHVVGLPLRALILAYLLTGRRRQEVLRLRWQDLDLEGNFYRYRGKGGKERQRVLPGAVRQAIEAYAHLSGSERRPDDAVFPGRWRDQPVDGNYFAEQLNQASEVAGVLLERPAGPRSVALLSLIERGKRQPSLRSWGRIRTALGIAEPFSRESCGREVVETTEEVVSTLGACLAAVRQATLAELAEASTASIGEVRLALRPLGESGTE